MRSSPLLYTAYGTLAAGVFEETARFVVYQILKRKHSGIGTGLAYGIGHGGVESVLLAGLAMISNIVVSVMLNMGMREVMGTALPEEGLRALIDTSAGMFLLSGLERVGAITLQIALSILVWYAVTVPKKLWLYPAAILLHAIADVPAALMQAGVLQSVILVEALVFVCAAAFLALAVAAFKKFEPKTEGIS